MFDYHISIIERKFVCAEGKVNTPKYDGFIDRKLEGDSHLRSGCCLVGIGLMLMIVVLGVAACAPSTAQIVTPTATRIPTAAPTPQLDYTAAPQEDDAASQSDVQVLPAESGLAIGVSPEEDASHIAWDEPTVEQALERESGLVIPVDLRKFQEDWKLEIVNQLKSRDYELNQNNPTKFYQYQDQVSGDYHWVEVPIAENGNMLWTFYKIGEAVSRYGEYPIEMEMRVDGDTVAGVPNFDTGFMEIPDSQGASVAFTGEGGKPVPVRNPVELNDGRIAYLEFFNVWDNEWQINQAVKEASEPEVIDYGICQPENFKSCYVPPEALFEDENGRITALEFLRTLSQPFDVENMKSVPMKNDGDWIGYPISNLPNFSNMTTIGPESGADFRRGITTWYTVFEGREYMLFPIEFCDIGSDEPENPQNNVWVIGATSPIKEDGKFTEFSLSWIFDTWRNKMKYNPLMVSATDLLREEPDSLVKRTFDEDSEMKRRINRFVAGDRSALDGKVLLIEIIHGTKGWYK